MSSLPEESRTMDLPALLAEAMERLELTQDELADRVGVLQGTISKWLLASRLPRPELWGTIATAIGVDKSVVSTAVGETKKVRARTLTVQLAEAQAEIARLRSENRDLQARLRSAR